MAGEVKIGQKKRYVIVERAPNSMFYTRAAKGCFLVFVFFWYFKKNKKNEMTQNFGFFGFLIFSINII